MTHDESLAFFGVDMLVADLVADVAALEADCVAYRELLQLALGQLHAAQQENRRLRASREAEAAITGHYAR